MPYPQPPNKWPGPATNYPYLDELPPQEQSLRDAGVPPAVTWEHLRAYAWSQDEFFRDMINPPDDLEMPLHLRARMLWLCYRESEMCRGDFPEGHVAM